MLSAAAMERLRRETALALSAVALKNSADTIEWLAQAPSGERERAIGLLREGFERLEEDLAEEQFFAASRAAYWNAGEGTETRAVAAALIDKLEF